MKYTITYQFHPFKGYRQAGIYPGKVKTKEIEAPSAGQAEQKFRVSVPQIWAMGGNEIGTNVIKEIKLNQQED